MRLRVPTLALALALAACTPPRDLARAPGSPWRPVPDVPALALAVTGCADPALCVDLRSALVGLLMRDIAPSILPPGQPAALTLTVEVTAAAAPDLPARAFGATADAPKLVATVTAARGSEILRRFAARAAPATQPGRQAAIGDFAEQIAAALRF